MKWWSSSSHVHLRFSWEQLTKRGSLYELKNSVTVRPGSKFVCIWDIFTIVNPPSMFLMSSTGIESWGCKSVITYQIILREPAYYPGIKIIDGDAVPVRLHPLDPELQLDDVSTRRGFKQNIRNTSISGARIEQRIPSLLSQPRICERDGNAEAVTRCSAGFKALPGSSEVLKCGNHEFGNVSTPE